MLLFQYRIFLIFFLGCVLISAVLHVVILFCVFANLSPIGVCSRVTQLYTLFPYSNWYTWTLQPQRIIFHMVIAVIYSYCSFQCYIFVVLFELYTFPFLYLLFMGILLIHPSWMHILPGKIKRCNIML